MFTKVKIKSEGNRDFFIYECHCLSTDDKKTDGITNGSVLIEMDTKDVYMFDEANTQWRKL